LPILAKVDRRVFTMKRILGYLLVITLIVSLFGGGISASDEYGIDSFTTEQIFGVLDGDFSGAFMLNELSTAERDYNSGYYLPLRGMVVSLDDKLLVADTQYGRINVFNTELGHDYSFGELGYGDGKMLYPVDIAEDNGGNFYIADFFGMCVLKFSSSGEFMGKFGTEGKENGQFIGPGGVAVDVTGNIYVSDCTTARIQKFDSSFNYIETLNEMEEKIAPLSSPGNIRIGPNGNIYVAEMSTGQIYMFDKNGKYKKPFLNLENHNIVKIGSFDISSDGTIYVHDRAPSAHTLQIYDSSGEFISSVENIFNSDTISDGFAIAADGSIFIHSYGMPTNPDRYYPDNPFIVGNDINLVKLDEDGKKVNEKAFDSFEYGRAGDMKDCAVTSSGKVYGLSTLLYDSSMNNKSEIFVWDEDGDIIDIMGPEDIQQSSSAVLTAIAVDSYDNLFVGVEDKGETQIIKLDMETDEITSIGKEVLNSSSSIAVDAMDNVYVADSVKGSVSVFTGTGKLRNEFKLNFSPNAVDVDQFRNICVVSDNQVVVINRRGREVAQFGGQARDKGFIYYPRGVVFTNSGDIIISDTENFRLQVFSKVEGYEYKVKSVSPRMFGLCKGITWGPDNKLYVADSFHGVVHKVSIEGQTGDSEGGSVEPPIPPEPPEKETILSDGELFFNHCGDLMVQSGSMVDISVDIDFGSNIYGVGMTLKYDPTLLKLEKCSEGDFLNADGNENLFYYEEKTPGTVVIAGPTRTGAVGGANGSGTLVNLTFSGASEGESALELVDVTVVDPNLNNIQVVTKGCNIKIKPMDSKPPEITADVPNCSWNDEFVLNGKTERGAKLSIDFRGKVSDIPIKPDGSFSYKLKLSNGDNTFKLISEDEAGNQTVADLSISFRQRKVIIMWVGKQNYISGGNTGVFDVPPQIIGGSTYVPLRALGDLLGCETEWFDAERKVVYTYIDPCSGDKTVLDIWIGKQIAKMNGRDWDMGKAPQIVNGRTLVPLRAISEGLGADVGWEGTTKQITITHPKR